MAGKILIVTDGANEGTIERMARMVAAGIREEGLEAVCESVENTTPEDFIACDGLILGSACYFAGPTAAMKALMDKSWSVRGKLVGKVGGAFTASGHIGGGNEMTLHALLDFFLVHGMIVQGDSEGDYFGPVALNPSGDQEEVVVDDSGECRRLGARMAGLIKRLG